MKLASAYVPVSTLLVKEKMFYSQIVWTIVNYLKPFDFEDND